MFIETSDKCSAGELEKSREHSAMYVSREYKQLKNDTLQIYVQMTTAVSTTTILREELVDWSWKYCGEHWRQKSIKKTEKTR